MAYQETNRKDFIWIGSDIAQAPAGRLKGDMIALVNGDEFTWYNAWVQTRSGGAAYVITRAGSVWSYGGWPAGYFKSAQGSAGAVDNALLLTALNLQSYDCHMIQMLTGSADMEVTLDGANWTAAASVMVEDLGAEHTSGGYDLVTTMTLGKAYRLKGKYFGLRIRNTAVLAATCVLVSGVA